MGVLTYILGKSGTGKSYSMRNFPGGKLAVINVQGKILPFRGSGKINTIDTDQSDKIVKSLKELSGDGYKSIVIDDYQYVMANEFMRRSTERGYDKFTDIGRHAWDIANVVRELPNDVIVYILCHTDRDDDGNEKIKTIGKLLDEKICLEGMSTIVLKTNVTDGVYSFLTQNNGRDTVKSPAGMFPSYAIDNDLYYVDQKIRNYYGIGEFLTDEEIKEVDEAAKKVDVIKDDGKKKRGRRSAKKEESTEASEKKEKAEGDEKHSGSTSTDSPSDAESKPARRGRRTKADNAAADESTEPVADEPVHEENVKKFRSEDEPVKDGGVEAVLPDEKPKKRTRKTREQVKEENEQNIVNANLSDEKEEVPFEEAEEPEIERLPRRRRKRGKNE